MPMKDLIQRLQPVQLYIILFISITYFIVQLILSHITHALTLLIDSYHMLCNIIALTGCILTIKHCKKIQPIEPTINEQTSSNSTVDRIVELPIIKENVKTNPQRIPPLKNTFGWTRIDILTMLIVCIFLGSLSFSLLVEALQTLVHIEHQDTMHHPIPVFITGIIGVLINGLCYALIGGYTFHQGSFFLITSTGDVVLDRVVTGDAIQQGKRRLSKTKHHMNTSNSIPEPYRRQNFIECFRDICSTIFVIICSVIIYFADNENVSKFVDPLISILSCLVLLILSYPYMKESCLILLQTIPGTIDIELFKKTLLITFSDIVNVHDLHIWQLTRNKYVSTVHILFQDPLVYTRIGGDILKFFHENGISIVTIQPEFDNTLLNSVDCLVKCSENSCKEKNCCREVSVSMKSFESNELKKDSIEINNESNQGSYDVIETSITKIEKTSSTQSLHSLIEKNQRLSIEDKIGLTILRTSVSESNLTKIGRTRKISELDENFENKLNAEIADDLDKIGKQNITLTQKTDNNDYSEENQNTIDDKL